MNGSIIPRIAITLVCIIAALWITLDLFTSGSNVVARIYGYLTVAVALIGMLAPRGAFYLVILMTAYLDFFKRFMILDSAVSKLDLYLVMGMGPAAMSGITANLTYRSATGNLNVEPLIRKVSAIVVTVMGVGSALMLAGSDSRFRAAGDAVNTTVYFSLFFVLPILFPTPADLHRLIYRTMIIYIPAVLYMLVHAYRASVLDMNPPVFWWELEYVKSGLTIEIRQLAERRFRPFGTMGNAASVSLVFCSFVAILFSGMWRWTATNPARSHGFKPIRIFWAAVVTLAAVATFNRTGWVCGALAILAAFLFRSRFLTVVAYFAGIFSLVSLIASSGFLLKHKILWNYSQALFKKFGSDEGIMTTNLSTFDDRLKGFETWSDPRAWNAFGLAIKGAEGKKMMGEFGYHDVLTGLLLKVGYVPLAFLIVLVLWMLSRLHAFLQSLPAGRDKSMGNVCLACGLLLVASGATTSAIFFQYPVNYFISFFLAVPTALFLQARIARAGMAVAEPAGVESSAAS